MFIFIKRGPNSTPRKGKNKKKEIEDTQNTNHKGEEEEKKSDDLEVMIEHEMIDLTIEK